MLGQRGLDTVSFGYGILAFSSLSNTSSQAHHFTHHVAGTPFALIAANTAKILGVAVSGSLQAVACRRPETFEMS
jgi:hypothetical protein